MMSMMSETGIRISKKDTKRGDDGYKTFSIRVREDLVLALNDMALKTNRSRNDLINIMLEYGVKNAKIDS